MQIRSTMEKYFTLSVLPPDLIFQGKKQVAQIFTQILH